MNETEARGLEALDRLAAELHAGRVRTGLVFGYDRTLLRALRARGLDLVVVDLEVSGEAAAIRESRTVADGRILVVRRAEKAADGMEVHTCCHDALRAAQEGTGRPMILACAHEPPKGRVYQELLFRSLAARAEVRVAAPDSAHEKAAAAKLETELEEDD